jgi:hypothetical protein
MTIDAPGIYDMPAAAYHADPCPAPSLSCSIAVKLCQASPAHARAAHPRLTPDAVEEKAEAFDLGTVAHALLLEGSDARVAVIDAKDFRTKAAQEARDAAYAAGQCPILAARWTDVQAMVAAARGQLDAHRDGGRAMFTSGKPEQTVIWQEAGGVWCRARLDYLRLAADGPAVDDYKTTSGSANPEHWSRSLFDRGGDLQAAWYRRAVLHVTGVEPTFRYAVQETFPPYALSVISLGPDALLLAEKKCLYALEQWTRCLARNEWPSYPRETAYAGLPPWEEARWLERELREAS